MIGKSKDAPEHKAVVRPFSGFSHSGQYFTSEIKIENSQTRFADWVIREILADYLSPQDVHFLVLKENLGSAFRCQQQWANLNRFWEWPLAHAGTSMEQYIRSLGGKHPWLTDEYRWTTLCDSAEKKHGHESRLVHPLEAMDAIDRAGIPEIPRPSDSV